MLAPPSSRALGVTASLVVSLFAAVQTAAPSFAADPAGKLPPDPPPFQGVVGRTIKDSKAAFPEPVRAPKDAPNVVIIMTDDTGFGHASTFGGPIPTPTLDRLAKNGLRYNRFHTTALCSPTRAALLSGRNHHSVNSAHRRGVRHGLSRLQLDVAPERCADLGSAQRQRLQHGRLRQVAQHAQLGIGADGTLRSLAHEPGLSILLRLSRRRHEPVVPGAGREHETDRAPLRPQLSLHDRHDEPGHRLGPHAKDHPARQALLRLFRSRRDARATPRPKKLDRPLQRAVRPGLGQGPRRNVCPPETVRHRPARHDQYAAAQVDPCLGLA